MTSGGTRTDVSPSGETMPHMVSEISEGHAPAPGTFLTLGGGGFSTGESPLLDDLLLDLAGERAAAHGRAERPRICFVPTASGDAAAYADLFCAAFADKAEPSVLSLFNRDGSDLRAHLLSQDAVFVGGGSTLNLLALWRLHGLDAALVEAAAQGVVMSGVSAGMNCWFESSVTDSHGPLAALTDGLGLLPGSVCPHYDGEADRRPVYRELVATGELPAGYAVQDGCALLWRDGALVGAYAERPEATAFRVHRAGDALDAGDATDPVEVAESPVETTYLG